MSTISNILSLIQTSLPKPSENPNTEEKSKYIIFKNGQDALAALFHAIMISFEFRLIIGFGEEDNLNVYFNRDSEGNIITLPDVWDAQGPNIYAFRYKHPQSSLTFLIKCIKMAEKFMVHGMAVEDNKITTLEIMTNDYVYPSIFPYTLEIFEFQPLLNVYISESRINDLFNQYKTNIINKLIPNLYIKSENSTIMTTPSTSTRPTQPDTSGGTEDPLHIPTRQPPPFVGPPIFEPLINNPFEIGQDDLYPLGSNNPLMGPPRFGGIDQGGGMYVGPDHPIFGQRDPNRGGDDIYGGPQTLPRGAVPPGARFDPIVPFGPQPLPNPGQPRGSGNSRGNFLTGGPDNDQLPPPGL